jgi:UDP-N-acetylmuramoyl-tripeptide--D-alanyl-D-alanine ligase
MWRSSPPSSPCIWNSFPASKPLPDAKAEIFAGIEPGGAAMLNRDNSQFARLSKSAKRLGIEQIVSFGSDEKADAR